MAKRIQNLNDVIESYDVVLSDVWGVVHNGVEAFQHSCTALAAAREAGATVVLITNSPRPAPGVIEQMRHLGVPDGTYDRIVTSGDVTRHLVAEGPKKVFLLGPERDLNFFDGLGIEIVAEADADCVVCTGFFDDEKEVPEDYTQMLTTFINRDVPMICANPDLVVERGHRIIPCAGAVAAYYEQLGGQVRHGQGHRLRHEALASAVALTGRWSPGDRQQYRGARLTRCRGRTPQLAVRRFARRRRAGRGHLHHHPDVQGERRRPTGVYRRCHRQGGR